MDVGFLRSVGVRDQKAPRRIERLEGAEDFAGDVALVSPRGVQEALLVLLDEGVEAVVPAVLG